MRRQKSAPRPRRSHRGSVSLVVLASLVVSLFAIPFLVHVTDLTTAQSVGYAHLVPGTPGPSEQNFTVNVTDNGYEPSVLNVSLNASLQLHLVNVGQVEHTFTLDAQPNAVIPQNITPAQLLAQFAPANASLVNLSLAPGASGWFNHTFRTLQNPSGDSYEFLSLASGGYQFKAGFYGFLHVVSAVGGPHQVVFLNATGAIEFVPSVIVAPTVGLPIVFEVGIQGALSHTFTLDSIPNDTGLSNSFSNTQLLAYFVAHPPLVDDPLTPNTAGVVTPPITMPSTHGIYEFVCTVPGHFPQMQGHVYVGVTPQPPNNVPVIGQTLQVGLFAVAGVILGGAGIFVWMGMSEKTAPRSRREQPRPPPPRGEG